MTDTRTITVVTGTRSEFGLLRSVMHAIRKHPGLELNVWVTGTHLLEPDRTIDEVAGEFEIAETISMQQAGDTTREADALALGRGITGFAQAIARHKPTIILVLGDRIEAFAAACAAAVAGTHVAHMHGGDRAEGIADEGMRHAISKLAHIHFPATEQSANRLVAMGEQTTRIHVVGSPATDDLAEISPLPDEEFASMGTPQIVFLHHPTGRTNDEEHHDAARLLSMCQQIAPTLALYPNHDPGRMGIVRAIEESDVTARSHLPRPSFIGLLKRVKLIVGNSSAGLIECAALGVPGVNIEPRQAGREASDNVNTVPRHDWDQIERIIRESLQPSSSLSTSNHPFGDGQTGRRTADILVDLSLNAYPLSKHNTY